MVTIKHSSTILLFSNNTMVSFYTYYTYSLYTNVPNTRQRKIFITRPTIIGIDKMGKEKVIAINCFDFNQSNILRYTQLFIEHSSIVAVSIVPKKA